METLTQAGRKFYGVCLAGLGIQQIIHADFIPVILPAWPAWIPGGAVWAYLTGAALIIIGAAMFIEKHGRTIALITGGLFLLLFALCHTPHLLIVNPYSSHLGTWTNALKMLALSGGAFVVAGSYPNNEISIQSSRTKFLERLIPFGRVFFSVTMIIFGIDHFLYVEFVAALVPDWIPWHLFWTYFAAIALIGSGVTIILKIKLKLVGILLSTMILLWFILLHIPRAIADPFMNKGNEVTSAFQALGFSGIAFLIAFGARSSVNSGLK